MTGSAPAQWVGTRAARQAGMGQMNLKLVSEAFEYGQTIPPEYTCDGSDHAPPLRWENPPEDARSFVLIVDDPDAPNGVFTHWVRFDIPSHQESVTEERAGVDGRNDFQVVGYGGPCPPMHHHDHRYFFHLYALDVATLGLMKGATRSDVEAAMRGHILAETTLMGRYGRGTGSN